MKKLLLPSIAFAALIAGPATAADLARPVYKAPPPPPPIYNWTGFYVGGNVGYSWGSARTDIAGSATTISSPGNQFAIQNPPIAFADSQTQRLNGVIGGGQVGYNYQFSPRWVLGFEADIQGSGERGSNTSVGAFSGRACFESDIFPGGPPTPVCLTNASLNGTAVTRYEAKIGSFGTVRGRLGVVVSDQVLLYGTLGLAYGRVELSGNTNVNGSATVGPGGCCGLFTFPFATSGTTVFSESKTKVGLAVGGGIEGKFSYLLPAGWTWKVEYLYIDLGSLDIVSPFPAASPLVLATPFTGTITTHTRFTDNVVRVGLNYKFGGLQMN